MPTPVRSFCKINLGLAVGPARADGFHGLTTMYQTLALHDLVTVTAEPASETRITLTTNHPGVPTDNRNTAWKMVERTLSVMGVSAAVKIHIQKQLPIQGGLGAGSANAVAALGGLERELGSSLPGPERLSIAEAVGSDVPLFLLGGTVLGVDRGQEVYPLPDLPAMPCVVAVPGVGVSTKLAFEALDKRESGELTSEASEGRLKQLSRALAAVWTTSGAEAGALRGTTGITGEHGFLEGDLAENPLLALVRTGIANDFEEVAFAQHPFLRSTKRDLMGDGHPGDPGTAVYAALSGSGSALFGLYRNQADACAAQQRVQSAGMQAILTETLRREAYWASMFAE
ncbi:MAG TPA: 4-(cytidine 5'-diphospho)-2-C-methyl-D-erythritol kinase [Acidobacteriaceae bacterium]|jgi:4-diphosphocytidyl-2-C-methyl-D-erythritol kinase